MAQPAPQEHQFDSFMPGQSAQEFHGSPDSAVMAAPKRARHRGDDVVNVASGSLKLVVQILDGLHLRQATPQWIGTRFGVCGGLSAFIPRCQIDT
ncbi:MAG: hypothetical protein ACTH8F_13450 [Microbacterium sp.]